MATPVKCVYDRTELKISPLGMCFHNLQCTWAIELNVHLSFMLEQIYSVLKNGICLSFTFIGRKLNHTHPRTSYITFKAWNCCRLSFKKLICSWLWKQTSWFRWISNPTIISTTHFYIICFTTVTSKELTKLYIN